MSVKEAVRPVVVPRQAGPVEPPPAPPAPAPARPVSSGQRLLPVTPDERQFVLGIAGVFAFLSVVIVTFLLLSVHVW